MYANQINVIFKLDKLTSKKFAGIFACDKTKDNFNNNNSFVLVNTDNSNNKGEQWLLFFKQDDITIFFDSLAYTLDAYNTCVTNAFLHFSKNSKESKYNTKRLQYSDSSLCGVYCIYVARELCKGKTINMIEESFTQDLIQNDKKLKAWFKVYLKTLLPSITFYFQKGQFCVCEKAWKH
jgi:hypothetical protein